MSEYKEIPEWKKKILTRKNKRDRSKILRNQHKKSLQPKINKIILQLEEGASVSRVVSPIKKKTEKSKFKKILEHYEELISSSKNKN